MTVSSTVLPVSAITTLWVLLLVVLNDSGRALQMRNKNDKLRQQCKLDFMEVFHGRH